MKHVYKDNNQTLTQMHGDLKTILKSKYNSIQLFTKHSSSASSAVSKVQHQPHHFTKVWFIDVTDVEKTCQCLF